MKLKITSFIVFAILFLQIFTVNATEIINIKHSTKDITSSVREAINCAKEKEIKIVFEKGIYTFLPEYAHTKFSFITNHGNGYKSIAFRFEDFNAIEIEGNGSEFIFHGRMAPFQFENCKNIKAYVFGQNKNFFTNKLKKLMKYDSFIDLKSLVKKLFLEIRADKNTTHKTILFSPSAASFDNFKNFEKRGEYFNQLIKKYINA